MVKAEPLDPVSPVDTIFRYGQDPNPDLDLGLGLEEDKTMDDVWEDLMDLDTLPTPPHLAMHTALPPAPLGPVVVPAPVPIQASDLSAVLGSLSPELKLRFLDKLAESMGTALAMQAGTPAQVHMQATQAGGQDKLTHLPEIAMPLASAALNAFMMASWQSLGAAGSVGANSKSAVCA
jgi:hypothetical protein